MRRQDPYVPAGELKLEDADFQRLRRFMQDNYGVNLEKKKTMVEGRLAAMIQQKGYSDFHRYVEELLADKTGVMAGELTTKLTTNYTYFMREEAHYQFLTKAALPEWTAKVKNNDLRIWSAGCSSGEEPYTTAMVLCEYFGPAKSSWDTTILATDISTKVLAAAREAIYPGEHLERLPERWRKKYFVPLSGNRWQVTEALRKEVVLGRFNLMGSFQQFRRGFHVIFCRNVMIYFDSPTKKDLAKKFYDALEPGGYLFIGLSETLSGIDNHFLPVAPGIYKKRA